MAFYYHRTVRFHETDAAGVVYFANTLVFCHEAYEASLIEAGIEARQFFSAEASVAFPIVHAEVEFLRPAFCGDRQEICLIPSLQTETAFEVQYSLTKANHFEETISKALTRHLCINPITRQRQPLTPLILDWLEKWR